MALSATPSGRCAGVGSFGGMGDEEQRGEGLLSAAEFAVAVGMPLAEGGEPGSVEAAVSLVEAIEGVAR